MGCTHPTPSAARDPGDARARGRRAQVRFTRFLRVLDRGADVGGAGGGSGVGKSFVQVGDRRETEVLVFGPLVPIGAGSDPEDPGKGPLDMDPAIRGLQSWCSKRRRAAFGFRPFHGSAVAALALDPRMQNPLPNGSLQNAIGECFPPSNFCSHLAPAFKALAKTVSRSSTWKSM